MKRLIPIALILAFLLTGCQIKEYTPELPLTFNQKAKVSTGDFSFNCEICKTETDVTVTVLSTNASSMTMSYEGSSVLFKYSGYSYSLDKSAIEPDNTAVVVYDVINCLFSDTQISSRKIDGGYQYEGRIAQGSFKLILNDDNTLNRIVLPAYDMSIDFSC